MFAPAGEIVPVALAALDRGGTLAIAGIHLSDIPALRYADHLFQERQIRSVTANTRRDGEEFLAIAERISIRVETVSYPLEKADAALRDLAHDRVTGAACSRWEVWMPTVPDEDGLEVLSDAEAMRLPASHQVGRLTFAHEAWPVILPVNDVYEEPTIVIRTGPGAKLEDAPLTAVAFEVDAADPSGAWGWSVLVQGPAFDITDALDERSRRLRQLPVRPWAPGVRDHWLTVTAVRLSGRRFGVVPG